MSNQPPSDPQRDNSEPPGRPPKYRPGYAPLPPVASQNPPTSQLPPDLDYAAAPEYGSPPDYHSPPPPGYNGPDYGPAVPAPRKSNAPLIGVIVAVTLLLCGGVATAGALIVDNVSERAKEAIEPTAEPTPPTVPTETPGLPTKLPGFPTDLPGLPTDLPDLPTDLPNLPGVGKKITVVYEVSGDGPAEIVYTEKLGESPKRVSSAKLPWKVTRSMDGVALVSVTAIRTGTGSGTIRCRATVDGEKVAERTREGTFAAASCTKMILS